MVHQLSPLACRLPRWRPRRAALTLALLLVAALALTGQSDAQADSLGGELAIDLAKGFGLQIQPLPEGSPAFYLDYHRNKANTSTSLGGRYVLRHRGSGIRLGLGVGTRFADSSGASSGPYVLAGIEWFFFWETEWVLSERETPEHRSGIRIRFR